MHVETAAPYASKRGINNIFNPELSNAPKIAVIEIRCVFCNAIKNCSQLKEIRLNKAENSNGGTYLQAEKNSLEKSNFAKNTFSKIKTAHKIT